jgi:hypothetical protein
VVVVQEKQSGKARQLTMIEANDSLIVNNTSSQ